MVMIQKTSLTVSLILFLGLTTTLIAQHLDVKGDVKIIGNMAINHPDDNSTV